MYLQDGRNASVTKYLPELQRRLLMRKLKLMDSHGVPNFDTPDSDRSVSARYESDVDGRESESERGSPEKERESSHESNTKAVGNKSVSFDSPSGTSRDDLLKTKKPDPAETDEDVSVRAGMTRLEAVGMRRSASSDTLANIAATKAKSPLGPKGDHPMETDTKPRSPKKQTFHGPITEEGSLRRALSIQRGGDGPRQEELPFELIALEVALEIVCNSLESEQRETVAEAKAGLEGLRRKVNTHNLERVRRVKTKLTRLTGRVAKVSLL